MKKRAVLFAVIGLICVFLSSGSAWAGCIVMGQQTYFKILPVGSLSATPGSSLPITLEVMNKTENTEVVAFIQVIVIDPFTGALISGPSVTQIPAKEGTVYPGGFVSLPISLGPIPKTTPNVTLAAIILILDKNDVVRGETGWGFVVN